MCTPVFSVRSFHRAVATEVLPPGASADPDVDVRAGCGAAVGIDKSTPWPTRRIRSCLASRRRQLTPPR